MKKKILLIAGGYSNEREISLLTAKSVFLELKKNKKYNLKIIEPDGKFVKKLRSFKPDVVLNLLHGRYGEDGYIQSILESEKIKYTHSGVKSSAIAIDKELSKKLFIKNKILTPKYVKFEFKDDTLIVSIDTTLAFLIEPSEDFTILNSGSKKETYIIK